MLKAVMGSDKALYQLPQLAGSEDASGHSHNLSRHPNMASQIKMSERLWALLKRKEDGRGGAG
ncbi:hypothetical protein E2C01_042296 [Portunus trituberculatus]|uniref:Uncharacterized protein n=1 Tax=Portunus trituberculatus TaxID=210409 RepID=A0A5B7FPU4_PORTR|nr:hypothetical protein [Portunus trituberculatus]